MKLRTRINLIVGSLSAAFVLLVLAAAFENARNSIHEEISAANTVATKLLSNVVSTYGAQGPNAMHGYLDSLGRVRAHEISLIGADGAMIYHSPASTYKTGRQAPSAFANLMRPEVANHEFKFADGAHLSVTPDASRAILDSWDDLVALMLIGALLFAVLNCAVFYFVSRTLSPLPVIAAGLAKLQRGELDYRLPELKGAEARVIGSAFNEMAFAMQAKAQAERDAKEAQTQLQERREFAGLIEQRLDEERRMIARELHDEFAQSVTAIRSLAFSITQSIDSSVRANEAATVIASEAAHLYDAMHSLIPRLAPLNLDTMGLADTLQAFVRDWQERHPEIEISLHANLSAPLGPSVTLAIYRVVQEGLINALRHGHPTNITISATGEDSRIVVRVVDDGVGLPASGPLPGRFGLRGLEDRIRHLNGKFRVANRDVRGVELMAEIPLETQS